jgi:DNA-binding LacI/PurR family transcriptional regulator
MTTVKPTRTVTLRQIAERTGLSVSAVSMALQDHPRIGRETKDRVRAVADELGYVANAAGRALRARRAGAIAVIVPNTGHHVFGHAYFMHVLTGVTDVANDRDAQLVVSTNPETSPDEAHGATAYERVMRSGSVDGAIVTSAAVTDAGMIRLVEAGLPVVLLGRFPGIPDVVSVGVDDRDAARRATEHLIVDHGRRDLVHLSGPLDHQTAIDRRDGFQDAVDSAGVSGRVLEGDFSEETGRRIARTDLASDPFDGLIAANDEMAFGAMTELLALGRDVPRDLAIIGFDDFGLSRVTTPGIATMHVPAELMARHATERLFDLVSGTRPAAEEAHLVLPVDFVPRASCGCGARTT